MSEEERDVRILALIQRGDDELRVAGQALEDGRAHLCASRAYRAMHAMVAAVLASRDLSFAEDAESLAAFEAAFVAPGHFPPAVGTALRQAHRLQQLADGQPAAEIPEEKAQTALKNATSVCYAMKDALTKWKQGRALR